MERRTNYNQGYSNNKQGGYNQGYANQNPEGSRYNNQGGDQGYKGGQGGNFQNRGAPQREQREGGY